MDLPHPVSKQPLPENAKCVFRGVIFDVYQWEQQGYDGQTKIFEKLKRPDTAMVIPVMEDGKIMVARQEQPGKEPFVGHIGGRADEGETAFVAAQRELLEETGFVADQWILLDAIQPTSKIEWSVYTFVAKGCKKVAEQNLDGAEKIELLYLDFDAYIEMFLQDNSGDQEIKIKFLEAKLDPQKMKQLRELLRP